MSDSRAVMETRDKIRRWLTDKLHGVEIDSEGNLDFRHGSARIRVTVEDLPGDDDDTVVEVVSPVLFDVPKTPELLEWVARSMSKYRFGTFFIVDSDDGNLNLLYRITLLGTYLDLPEFEAAYLFVAITADELDNELQEKFGGERFYEDD